MGNSSGLQKGQPWPPELQEAIKKEVLAVIDNPDHDDGSYAPLFIRLAFHSAGTWDPESASGGSNGATMRFKIEAEDYENNGLDHARDVLEPIKKKYPEISYSDLWVFAAYVGIEHTGGPSIPFVSGRIDSVNEAEAIPPGRLPIAEFGLQGLQLDDQGRIENWERLVHHIRHDIFGRMGFNDQESVALMCGGHVYGRCHNELSGYEGAWVENPTRFSTEYAADMIGDKWMPVMHTTKMPDGGDVPEEVRPAQSLYKMQYVNLTKYMPEEEEGEQEEVKAPDAVDWPPGEYMCISDWVNVRDTHETTSPIMGRFVKDQKIQITTTKVFSTAMRARSERGGWVSLRASGGKQLFERVGDWDIQALQGKYRVVAKNLQVLSEADLNSKHLKGLRTGDEFTVCQILVKSSSQGAHAHSIWGCLDDNKSSWVCLHSPEAGTKADMIIQGYNEKPRKAIKGQSTHQMMLASDMVLLWDEGYKKHLEKYAEDLELLKKDFGAAYKRMTELGCPWSKDKFVPKVAGGGCPLKCSVMGA